MKTPPTVKELFAMLYESFPEFFDVKPKPALSGERDMTITELKATAEIFNNLYDVSATARICTKAAAMLAADALEEEPYGWIVSGCSTIYRGEYGEIDAKSEAKRCGGTSKAITLYTKQQSIADLTNDESYKLMDEACSDIELLDLVEAKLKEKNHD